MTVFVIIVLIAVLPVQAAGLLPSLTETVGIAMPSLGEALGRYPDEETENGDGSITELYTNVSEPDFNKFSVYLERQEAELADYKVEKGVLTAEIRAKGESFSLSYNSKSGEAWVTYSAGTFDEWMKNAKNHFGAAQKLLADGKTDEAIKEIFYIPQFMAYGPVDILMKENGKFLKAITVAREAKCAPYRKVGNIVTFGTYPQTKEGTDQTPIEWIVLDYDKKNHKALLLSRYGLDTVPYNKGDNSDKCTWEQCTLRIWLNGDFLNKAFSAKEQFAILITNVDNSSGQGYSAWDTIGGNNTQDKIFLLSYAEVKHFFSVTYDNSNNKKSRIAPTAYAIAQGANTSDSDKTADGKLSVVWWLRSPGLYQFNAAYVHEDGSLGYSYVGFDDYVVRPVFWLNLESDIF